MPHVQRRASAEKSPAPPPGVRLPAAPPPQALLLLQRSVGNTAVQRLVDPTSTQLTPEMAARLSPDEIAQAIVQIRARLGRATGAERQGLEENLRVLEAGGQEQQPFADLPRPAGTPPGFISVPATYTAAPVPGAPARTAGADPAGEFAPGALAAARVALARLVDPRPARAATPGQPVYTRYVNAGPGELRPRLYQPGGRSADLGAAAEATFTRNDVTYQQRTQLARRLRQSGFAGLTPEEAALVRRVVQAHAVEGAVETSPLLSLTELPPGAARGALPPVASTRTYVVRVQMDPRYVTRVNDWLGETGRGQMAGELEVLTATDVLPRPFTRAASAPPAPRILSITANEASGAPLGGGTGRLLRGTGRALVFVGAGVAAYDVLSARGPHRRETQGRAFGSFAGGMLVGEFGVGLCIGLSVATGGLGIILCGLGFGLAGAAAGGLLGGAAGSLLDE